MARAVTFSLWALALPACHANDTQPAAEAPRLGATVDETGSGTPLVQVEPLAYLLPAPTPDIHLAGPPTPATPVNPGGSWGWVGRSVVRRVPIYNAIRGRRFEIGGLRLGSVVRLRPEGSSRGCRAGWFHVEPEGYACANHGLRVDRAEVPDATAVLTAPDPNAELPFDYVHVKDRSAWLYDRVPSGDEREAVLDGDRDTIVELDARSMDGAFFLAVESEPEAHPPGWLQTLEGNYVRADATRDVPPSKLQGSLLDETLQLPVAFVIENDAPVYESSQGTHEKVGIAQRYARVAVDRSTLDDELLRIAGSQRLLKAEHVRVATRHPMPSELEGDARWIHVDIASQTLVAYEGPEPRFATLIASGLSPRDTPTGDYDIRYKYRTTTMRGEDENGPFEVQEVPWTMFYYKSYAIHGAYWHDAFGAPRSHGCTNLAPLDARWVFKFTEPDLPPGWERAAEKGTYVLFTDRDSDA